DGTVCYSHAGADNSLVGEGSDIVVTVRFMEMVEVYRLADEGVAFEFIVSLIVGDGFEQAIICAVLTRKCAWVNPVQTVGNGGGFFLQQGIPSRKHFTNFI